MKKTFLSFVLLGSLAFAQDSNLLSSQELSGATLASDGHKQTLREKMLQKELELQVPRETVPVEAINYPIKTPIPKTTEYLPMLQTLLHIEAGSLPNPIGVSIIGSYTEENYQVTNFRGTAGSLLVTLGKFAPFLGIINSSLGGQKNGKIVEGQQYDVELSDGRVNVKTGAVGVKLDTWVFPFMQIFATGAYLSMEQTTLIGDTITIKNVPELGGIPQRPTGNIINIKAPTQVDRKYAGLLGIQGDIDFRQIGNKLDGWLAMGGTNLAIGYKGFFLSCMIAGGYVKLDDLANGIKGFVKKPFMYVAPRIGYSLGGVFTAHFGVQRVELFGSTSGNDLSQLTFDAIRSYETEIEKFPVNFLVGTNFAPMRDLGISFEYVFSPDVKGLNAEIAYRF